MRGFMSVFKREMCAYFTTPLAYVFLIIFLGFSGFLTFNNGFYEIRQADLQTFFYNLPMLLIFLIPAIAMRLWAEERKSGSIELLFSLPITTTQATLAKFLAAWFVVILALVLTAPMVWTVGYLGDPDWSPIITGYIGTVLIAAVFLAIGSFFSALTRNQVIAFVLGVVVCAGFLLAGNPSVLHFLDGWVPAPLLSALEGFSVQSRFESLQRGILQIRDLVFFCVLTVGWLWANIVILEDRKAA